MKNLVNLKFKYESMERIVFNILYFKNGVLL